jgi:hypothetical protein
MVGLQVATNKQVVAAQNEIRPVKDVAEQLPGEMLQQCSSANVCMQTHTVMKECYMR